MPPDPQPLKRCVVCAAVRNGHTVVVGVRHFDALMRAAIKAIGQSWTAFSEQGFVDQHGQFMTRGEAWSVAKEAGQIVRRVGNDDGTLYSENLY